MREEVGWVGVGGVRAGCGGWGGGAAGYIPTHTKHRTCTAGRPMPSFENFDNDPVGELDLETTRDWYRFMCVSCALLWVSLLPCVWRCVGVCVCGASILWCVIITISSHIGET